MIMTNEKREVVIQLPLNLPRRFKRYYINDFPACQGLRKKITHLAAWKTTFA
jgi:hypothetical protein